MICMYLNDWWDRKTTQLLKVGRADHSCPTQHHLFRYLDQGYIFSWKISPPPLTWNDKRCAKLNRGEKNYISGKQIEKRENLPLSIQYFSPISKSYNFFLKLSTWAKRRLFSYLFLLNQSPQFSDWKMRLLFLFPNVFLKIFPFIF